MTSFVHYRATAGLPKGNNSAASSLSGYSRLPTGVPVACLGCDSTAARWGSAGIGSVTRLSQEEGEIVSVHFVLLPFTTAMP